MVKNFVGWWYLIIKKNRFFQENMCSYITRNHTEMDTLRVNAKNIFQAGVRAVKPAALISHSVQVENDNMFSVNGIKYKMPKTIHVVGFGKAVAEMARAIEDLFGEKIKKGILSVPYGTIQTMKENGLLSKLPKENSKLQMCEGAKNNLPDENSFNTTKKIIQSLSQLKEEDLVFVLISGGGSALLTYPKPPITLAEKTSLIRELSKNGATIQELNCIRKRLSLVKGGGLAQTAYPSQVISLILSDVIGDPLDLIASSPTVENCDKPDEAILTLKKYCKLENVPKSITDCLKYKSSADQQNSFNHVHNYLIGSNLRALRAAELCANKMGYGTFILTNTLVGEAVNIGKNFAKLAYALVANLNSDKVSVNMKEISNEFGVSVEILNVLLEAATKALKLGKPYCVLSGGETTVAVKGSGKGGRNQEMCLSFSIECDNMFTNIDKHNVLFLSSGSDGIDGPTDAAGAMAYPGMVAEAKTLNLHAQSFLSNNDSYTFFKSFKLGEDHVVIGHTGTNVMDIQVLLIHPKL